jgi:carbohydrate-selective porin OprB
MKYALSLILCLTLVITAHADTPAPFSDRLTGDWGGARSTLAEHGVTMDLEWTNYF